MKSALSSVTVARFLRNTGTTGRESRAVKTWAGGTALVNDWARHDDTVANYGILVRPRWKNGLVIHETTFSIDEGLSITNLGGIILAKLTDTYGTRRLRSSKATLARECMARCAFSDEEDTSEDARAFDAAKRALEQCFPEHAAIYVDRIRSWMLDGGKIR